MSVKEKLVAQTTSPVLKSLGKMPVQLGGLIAALLWGASCGGGAGSGDGVSAGSAVSGSAAASAAMPPSLMGSGAGSAAAQANQVDALVERATAWRDNATLAAEGGAFETSLVAQGHTLLGELRDAAKDASEDVATLRDELYELVAALLVRDTALQCGRASDEPTLATCMAGLKDQLALRWRNQLTLCKDALGGGLALSDTSSEFDCALAKPDLTLLC